MEELIYRINKLQENLRITDYQAIEFLEGAITANEYAAIKKQREDWRKEIKELQIQINELENQGSVNRTINDDCDTENS